MFANKTNTLFRVINILGLFGICFILLIAFYLQWWPKELPCPLCLLQRVAFVAIGIGFVLNIKFDLRPSHYGLIVLGALFGRLVAARQVLLHVTPGQTPYGSAIFGLHDYSWSWVLFSATVLISAFLLLFDRQFSLTEFKIGNRSPGKITHIFGDIATYMFLLLVLLEIVFTLFECGFGLCPDNPVRYLL